MKGCSEDLRQQLRAETAGIWGRPELRLSALALVLLALLGSIFWAAKTIRGPTFRGRSAAYWMNYNYHGPAPDQQFQEAWTGLGSNAVPFLVKSLQAKDKPVPHFAYEGLWQRLPKWLKVLVPRPSPPAQTVRSRAAAALGLLGPASKPAIPALLRVMETDASPHVRQAATNALKQIDAEVAAKVGVP